MEKSYFTFTSYLDVNQLSSGDFVSMLLNNICIILDKSPPLASHLDEWLFEPVYYHFPGAYEPNMKDFEDPVFTITCPVHWEDKIK